MFYLNQFFGLLKLNPVKGITFFVMGIIFVFTASQKVHFDGKIAKRWESKENRDFFYALIPTEKNISRLQRKLLVLPGVDKVKILSKDILQKKVTTFLNDINSKDDEGYFELNYSGLKVVFNEKLKLRSQNLIRNYLLRLGGKSDITLGDTRSPDKQKTNQKALIFLKSWGSWGLMITLFTLWLLSALFFITPVQRMGYLIEQYQRKNYVSFKIFFSGTGLTFLLGSILAVSIGESDWRFLTMTFGLCFVVCLLSLKKFQWKS